MAEKEAPIIELPEEELKEAMAEPAPEASNPYELDPDARQFIVSLLANPQVCSLLNEPILKVLAARIQDQLSR